MRFPDIILCLILASPSLHAYEVWFAPCKAPREIVAEPADWKLVAKGTTGMNANFAPADGPRPGAKGWSESIARLDQAKDNVFAPFPIRAYDPKDFAPDSEKNAVTESLKRAKEWGYKVRYVMLYDQPDTLDEDGTSDRTEARKAKAEAKAEGKAKKARRGQKGKASEEEDEEVTPPSDASEESEIEGREMKNGGTRVGLWKGEDFQLIRDWLDANGHKDIGLMYNCRSYNKRENLAHPAIAAGLNEGSVTKWKNNQSGRHELLNWVSTDRRVRDKPFIFHLTLHHNFDAKEGVYQETRNFVRSISADILKSPKWMQGDNVIIMPMSYRDFPSNFPFLPELKDSKTYGNSFTGLILSLIEQEPLFSGKTGKLISEDQCASFERTDVPQSR